MRILVENQAQEIAEDKAKNFVHVSNAHNAKMKKGNKDWDVFDETWLVVVPHYPIHKGGDEIYLNTVGMENETRQ